MICNEKQLAKKINEQTYSDYLSYLCLHIICIAIGTLQVSCTALYPINSASHLLIPNIMICMLMRIENIHLLCLRLGNITSGRVKLFANSW